MHLKLIVTSLFCVIAALSLQGQEIQLAADTNQALIGERINVLLLIKADKSTTIDWPQITDNWQGLEVLAQSPKDTLEESGSFVYRQGFSLTAFDTGVYKIDSVALVFQRGNLIDSIYAYPMYLAFKTIKIDSTNRYYDIKKPMDIEYSYWREILTALALIALFLLAVWWWYKNRKPVEQKPENSVLVPAYITALNQLKELQASEAWLHMPLKSFYIELSTIMRRYLQGELAILAVETTTDEIIESLRSKTIEQALKTELQDLLQTSDLVKFAKVKPLLEEGERYLKIALEFVEKTKPSDTKLADNDE